MQVWVLWQPVKQVSGRSVAWTAGVPSEKGNKKWRPAAVAQGLASLKVSPLRSSSPRVAAPSRVSPNLLETGPETKNRDTGGNGNAAAAAGVPFVRPRGGSVDPENDPTNVVLRPGVAKQPKFVPTNAVDVVRRSIWSENYSSFSAAPSLELYTPIMQLWVTAATAAAASPVTTPRAVLQNALGGACLFAPFFFVASSCLMVENDRHWHWCWYLVSNVCVRTPGCVCVCSKRRLHTQVGSFVKASEFVTASKFSSQPVRGRRLRNDRVHTSKYWGSPESSTECRCGRRRTQ